MAEKKDAPQENEPSNVGPSQVAEVGGLGAIKQPGGTEPSKEEENFGDLEGLREQKGRPRSR